MSGAGGGGGARGAGSGGGGDARGGRLRVAQVVCTDAFAGAERYVTNLTSGLSALDCDVVVIGGDRDRMKPTVEAGGATWRAGATVRTAALALLRDRPFDIVHAHMTAAELAAVLASAAVRAPIVATRHFAQRRGSSPPAKLLGRLLSGRVAAQLAISEFVAVRTEGDNVVVFPGTPEVATAPAAEDRELSVLVAQRLEPEKRTDLSIRIWAEAGLADRGWRLDIAGEGQELGSLRALADRLGVAGSCHFLGPRRDVADLLGRASILLAARPDEPYGLSVVEAMATGLPVVAAAGGGHLETVGLAEGAALYPPDDLAAAGRLLRSLACDPQRRTAYGAELRALHRRCFTVDAQAGATLDVYRSILSRRAARG